MFGRIAFEFSFVLIFIFFCTASYFERGYDHHYVYTADSDYLGMQNVTTTVKFHVHVINGSNAETLSALYIDSIVQYAPKGIFADNPLKWDLGRRFLFRMSNDGVITLVHYHPDDPEENVLLKKVLSSTLSARLKISEDHNWKYQSTETDHLGELKHDYEGEHIPDGIRLNRYHRSLDRVERIHKKTLHYDREGTVHKVSAEDNVILEDRINDDLENKRTPIPGEYVIKHSSEGDIEKIHAKANVSLQLTNKVLKEYPVSTDEDDKILHTDDLVYKKKENKTNIKDIRVELEETLKCIHKYEDKSDSNRTICVNKFREKLMRLKQDQYITYIESVLKRKCDMNETLCIDERYLFIDIVSRVGDDQSQQLILKYVFETGSLDVEEFRRALFHFSTLENPIPDVVTTLERICFGENSTNHGAKNISRTEQRACLTLGALARTISTTNLTEAERLMEKIEFWMKQHDIVYHRIKRETKETPENDIHNSHLITHVALLHALGNAGLQRSLDHILNYTEPNARESAWRRAAIGATRHYTCHKSASALLKSMRYDKQDSVRRVALRQYMQHPKKFNISKEEENVILSKNYSYHTLMRSKREGFLESIDQVLFEILVEPIPELHWGKTIGSSKVGASFGVDFLNRLHIRIKPFSGFIHLNVHDKVYAEAHIGIINYRVEILFIELCYRGRLEYNVNLLKDFVYGMAQDLKEAYDAIADEVVSPMGKAVTRMKDVVKPHSKSEGIFNPLSHVVEQVPDHADDLVDALTDLSSVLDKISGLSWVTKIKEIIPKYKSFAEEMKQDSVNFYNLVSGASVSGLPAIEKDVVDSINLVTESVKKIGGFPRQGFATVDRAKQQMTVAMVKLVHGVQNVTLAISSDGGQVPAWMNPNELNSFRNNILPVLQRYLTPGFFEEIEMPPETITQVVHAIDKINQSIQDMNVFRVKFMDVYQNSMKQFKELKKKFDFLNIVTARVKATVIKVFGPKFHKNFHAQRRICDNRCKCGNWPTTTKGRYQNMPGIDVIVMKDETVISPLNGKVFKSANRSNEIRIEPTDDNFKDYDIIIANIQPLSDISTEGVFIEAGDPVGYGLGKEGCRDPFIHVAMRKMVNRTADPDSKFNCMYVDPSVFVDNIELVPKWHQDCKEFTFRHIGKTLDAGMVGNGFQEMLKNFKEKALEWAATNALNVISNLFPESSVMGKIGKFAKLMKNTFDSAHDLSKAITNGNYESGGMGIFQEITDIASGAGNILGDLSHGLAEMGFPGEVTDILLKIEAGSHDFAGVMDNLGDTVDNIADTFASDAEGVSGVADAISGIVSGTGGLVGDVSHLLADVGVSKEVTDIMDKVKTASSGVSNIISDIGHAADDIANNFKDSKSFSGVMKGLSSVSSSIGNIAGDFKSMFKDLGVSANVIDVFDKIENGAEGAAGVIGAVGEAVDDIRNAFKKPTNFGNVMNGLKSVASGIGTTAGKLSNFLKDVGVPGEAVDFFDKLEEGAKDASQIMGTVGSIGNAFQGFTKGNDFNGMMDSLSNITSGVGQTAGQLSKMLKKFGVSSQVTDVLTKMEGSASIIADTMGHIGTIGKEISSSINNKGGSADIIKTLSGISSVIETGAGGASNLLQSLGVHGDTIDILEKIKVGAGGTAGILDGVGSAIHGSLNQAFTLEGVSGIASLISNTTGAVGHLLSDVGASNDVTDILSKIEAGAGDASELITDIGSVGKRIMNGYSNPGSYQGISSLTSGLGNAMGHIGNVLEHTGASGETLDIFSKIQSGLVGTSNLVSELGSMSSNVFGQNGTKPSISNFVSRVGNTAQDVRRLLTGVGVNGEAINVLSKIQTGSVDAAQTINHLEQSIDNIHNMPLDNPNAVDVIDGFSVLSSSLGAAVGDVGDFLQDLGVSGDSVKVLDQIHNGISKANTISQDVSDVIGGISSKGDSGNFTSFINEVTNIASEIGSDTEHVGHLLRDIGISNHTTTLISNVAKGVKTATDVITKFNPSIANVKLNIGNVSDILGGLNGFTNDIGKTASHITDFMKDLGVPKEMTDSLAKFQTGLTDVSTIIRNLQKSGRNIAQLGFGSNLTMSVDGILNVALDAGNMAGDLTNILRSAGVSGNVVNALSKAQEAAGAISTTIDTVGTMGKSLSKELSGAFNSSQVLEGITSVTTNLANSAEKITNLLQGLGVQTDALAFLTTFKTDAAAVSSLVNKFNTTSQEVVTRLSQPQNISGILNTLSSVAVSIGKSTGNIKSVLNNFGVPQEVAMALSTVESGVLETSNVFRNFSRTGRLLHAISSVTVDDLKFSKTILSLNTKTNLTTILKNLGPSSENIIGMLKQIGGTGGNISAIINNLGSYGENVFKLLSSMKGSNNMKSNLLLAFGRGNLTHILSQVREEENKITQSDLSDSVPGKTVNAAKNVAKQLFSDIDVGSLTVSEWMDSLQDSDVFTTDIEEINHVIETYINSSQTPSAEQLLSMSLQNMGEFLQTFGLNSDGDKNKITSLLHMLPGKVCSEFKGVIDLLSICIPDADCHGLRCSFKAKIGVNSENFTFALRFSPENSSVQITLITTILLINPAGDEQVIPITKEIIPGYAISLRVMSVSKDFGSRLEFSMVVSICAETDASCLPDIKVFNKLTFHTTTRMKRSPIGKMLNKKGKKIGKGMLKKMPFGKFASRAAGKNIKTKGLAKASNKLRKGFKDKLTMKYPKGPKNFAKEFVKVKDSCDAGDDPEKFVDITIFKLSYTIGVGPIGITFAFGAGGAIGMSIDVDIKAMSGTSTVVLAPWVSGEIWGSVSVSLLIASGGVKLIGYILKTKFPITTESNQAKKPVSTTMRIDLELIPIELQLRAWAKALFITFYDGCLWKWSAPSIKWNILKKTKLGSDNLPPRFVGSNTCDRKRRDTQNGCSVYQVPNRHPSDTAFQLEVFAHDDTSDVKQSYCIGDYRGGQNVVGWTEFKGSTALVPMSLPNGIPLYFTVKARNSQGLETVTQCMLSTYDNTAPDGRVEASYIFSSHPNTVSASLVVLDDSPLSPDHVKALGYSPGAYGREVLSWKPLDLITSSTRPGVLSSLKYFSAPREGRLTAKGMKTLKTNNDVACATECISYGSKCVSFDFEYHTQTCEIHEMIEGPFAKLRISGTFHNYERLDIGYNSFIEYRDLALEHGAMYYINVVITNTLGYRSVLSSKGTMVDFIPPEPGYVGKPLVDTIKADKCKAAVTQRCIDVTAKPNHRMIIDGWGGRTVFNGHKPGEETLYTLANHYISTNFDGFHDPESDIWGYTWAAGKSLCNSDIVNFTDPHAHLSSPKYWTFTGYAKDIHLPDGPYYVTVQALNNIVHGGALVTTVCHSTPIIVDTTPPEFHEVTDIMFDEDFDILAVYYNVTDEMSKIARVDFGLGKTKHDVDIRGYDRHDHMTRLDPYFVVENLDLTPGVPAWIRVRAVNNVDLFASGHGNEPIMIDKTPPLVGTVVDGDLLDQDIQYQHATDKICGQWKNFFDPESGIRIFTWGVGTEPLKDNIVRFQNVSHYTKSACSSAKLTHNATYFSTIIAFNDALNSKSSNGSSDGVLVDTTEPKSGYIHDGMSHKSDLGYSSESATIDAVWNNFTDPESGIADYTLDVFINTELKRSFSLGRNTKFVDHTLPLHHLDRVLVKLHAQNGAGLQVEVPSTGFLVDHTPPFVIYLSDSKSNTGYQSDNTVIDLSWKFGDPESGIKEYRFFIQEFIAGQKLKMWPLLKPYEIISVNNTGQVQNIELTGLSLKDGAKYIAKVTSLNKAMLSSSHESMGVIVDTTPPVIKKVHIGHLEEDEELDDNGDIQHDNPDSITISWIARDPESGIDTFDIAIGSTSGKDDVYKWTENKFDNINSVLLENLDLEPTAENNVKYFVSLKMRNKAGLLSNTLTSLPIKMLKANVPGVVFDGRDMLTDHNYQYDKMSMGMSFNGFESEACNIIGYEWSIGSQPYYSDILPFTDYGLVMETDSFGHAQIHLDFYEYETYYITVRARTGHQCRDEYIVSSSDGVTIDTKPPKIDMLFSGHTITTSGKFVAYFQNSTDSLSLSWNIADSSGVQDSSISVESRPFVFDLYNVSGNKMDKFMPGEVKLHQGETVFVNIRANDTSGLEALRISPPITVDISPPNAVNLSCTPAISHRDAFVKCSWFTLQEYESILDDVEIGVSTSEMMFDILNFTTVPLERRTWSRDFHKVLNTYMNASNLLVTLKLVNRVGLTSMLDFAVTIDKTPPKLESVSIVTSIGLDKNTQEQKCQIPTDYIEVLTDGVMDKESPVVRMEAALGTKPGTTDILRFKEVDLSQKIIFLNDISLQSGMKVYASVRIYNAASLYTTVTSNPVVISQNPVLTVNDGTGLDDEDYQSKISLISGHWKYSDPCPIILAEWAIEDLTGTLIQNFTKIPGNSNHFYNDELRLTNGFAYINTIRTTDVMSRIRIVRSDGISVRIQSPNPGLVRDGLEDMDTNYQKSVKEMSCNWDSFGKENDRRDPTQNIVRYEVAIGNDRRYEQTRSNVHYFVDVGLNTSKTFTNLNLTAKTVKYYFTVRAFSEAGGFVEVSSNGIRVGYTDGIVPGQVEYKAVQSSTDTIDVSWDGFTSDYGIRMFYIGIGKTIAEKKNQTLDCATVKQAANIFDVLTPQSIGLDTYVRLKNLTLRHGQIYFVTVVAYDEAGSCEIVTGDPVSIDTTSPVIGDLRIGLTDDDLASVIFVTDDTLLSVSWDSAIDNESQVLSYKVDVVAQKDCGIDGSRVIVDSKTTRNVTTVTFYYLNLQPGISYFVTLTAINEAGLNTSVKSKPIFVDTTDPLSGIVKIGSNWYKSNPMQSSTHELHGIAAIAKSEEAHKCPRQTDYDLSNFESIGDKFEKACSNIENSELHVFLGHDDSLTRLVKGGVSYNIPILKEGRYTINMKTMLGKNIISSVSLASDENAVPINAEWVDEESFLSNVSSTNADANRTQTSVYKGSGVGFLIFGYKDESKQYGIFWIRDKYQLRTKRIELDTDMSANLNKYDMVLTRKTTVSRTFWEVSFLINDELKSNLGNIDLDEVSKIIVFGNNENGYYPPLLDPFHPFKTELVIHSIMIPNENDHLCVYGAGFYDKESHIKEVWAGISESVNETDNIMNFQLVKQFCLPCMKLCPNICNDSCEDTSDFDILPLSFYNLSLLSVSDSEIKRNQTIKQNGSKDFEDFQSPAYYISVKVINFAGKTITSTSKAISIDTTPPKFLSLNCVDPDNSMDEPVLYQKSTTSVGAFWECEEDAGQISGYWIDVGTSDSFDDIINDTFVGIDTKTKLGDLNGTLISGKTYFITVTAKNTAGLSSRKVCNITVDTKVPDTKDSSPALMFSKKISDAPENIGVIESGHQIGIQWKSDNADIEYYEWQIGSIKDGDDIFPRVRIGSKYSTSVAIVDGKMWLDGQNTNSTLAQYLLRNWTDDEIEKAKANDFFNIEPGRCMYISLFGVSRSHVSTEIPVEPICFKRNSDFIKSFTNETLFTLTIVDGAIKMVPYINQGHKDFTMNISGIEGGIISGLLHNEDTSSNYGTAASGNYKPFIANPETTTTSTSRLLHRRLLKYGGLSFYLSPTGTTTLKDWVDIKLKFNKTDITSDNDIPALIYWDTETGVWKHVEEDCIKTVKIDFNANTYFAKVCLPKRTEKREKRQTYEGYQVTTPRQFSLMIIKKTIINEPPVVLTKLIAAEEDKSISYKLKWYDDDGDHVIFKMASPPVNGFANISKEGVIFYQPKTNFFGVDTVMVTATEFLAPTLSTTPHRGNFSIDIMVANKNDAPAMYFWSSQNTTFNTKDHNKVVIKLEGNVSTYNLGVFIAFDEDSNDTLQREIYTSAEKGIDFNLNEIPNIPEQAEIRRNITNTKIHKVYNLSISLTSSAHGEVDYGLLVHDEMKYYSKPVWLKIYVMNNPCVHGRCRVDPVYNVPCDDIIRSRIFTRHRCLCEAGYEGYYCDEEINECRVGPCPLMYDCHDLLADYECVINMSKLMAILVCIGLASGLAGFVFYRKYQQKKKQRKVEDLWKPSPQDLINIPGPSHPTNSSTSDKDESTDESEDETEFERREAQSEVTHPPSDIDISFLKNYQEGVSSKLPPHHHRFKMDGPKSTAKSTQSDSSSPLGTNISLEMLQLKNHNEITPIDV